MQWKTCLWAELQPWCLMKDLPLGRTHDDDDDDKCVCVCVCVCVYVCIQLETTFNFCRTEFVVAERMTLELSLISFIK